MRKSFRYLCLINAIYDFAIGIMSLLPDPTVSWEVMGVAWLFGICSIALGLGLVAAFRNPENLLIIPVMNIVANFGIAADYLWLTLFAPIAAELRLIPLLFAIIPFVFGLLLLAYMLTTKGSFSAAFKAAPTKK